MAVGARRSGRVGGSLGVGGSMGLSPSPSHQDEVVSQHRSGLFHLSPGFGAWTNRCPRGEDKHGWPLRQVRGHLNDIGFGREEGGAGC